MSLAEKKCLPCSGAVDPFSPEEVEEYHKKISSDWEITHNHTRLLRKFKLKEMKVPMELGSKIAVLADEQWHHPELHIGFGHIDVEVWTHKINGLVEADFVFAAKVDELAKDYL